MKELPTLFVREFDKWGKLTGITKNVTPGCEFILDGRSKATELIDGAPCKIESGKLYKMKRDGSGWVEINKENPRDKWLWNALVNTPWVRGDGYYHAVGIHFCGNPYRLDDDFLEKDGRIKISNMRHSFYGVREYLEENRIYGIVWWKDEIPWCIVKRTDFGFEWGQK